MENNKELGKYYMKYQYLVYVTSNKTSVKMKYWENILDVLKNINNHKTLGNDELTKAFYKAFWDSLKKHFLSDINQAKITQKKDNITKRGSY